MTLSNVQINEMMEGVKEFQDCYPKDALGKLKIGKSCIINLDDQSGSGTHWVCLYNGKDAFYYFDSYGVVPPNEVVNLVGKKKKCLYSNLHVQQTTTDVCGYYCMFVLCRLHQGHDFTDIMYSFSLRPSENDRKIIQQCRRELKKIKNK